MQPATNAPQPTPPAPPSPPDAPTGAVVRVPGGADMSVTVTGQELAVPTTQREVDALQARGERLSNQLLSAQGRRDDVAKELRAVPITETAIRSGLEQRLGQLDARILDIERAIEVNGRLLAAAPPALLSNAATRADDGRPFDLSSGQITGISIVSVVFVGMPLAVGAAIMMYRRSNRPNLPAVPPATQQRLERMEQAIDTIAIEMERVSENQRFLTRVLTEGPAQPIAIGERVGDAVRSAHDE